MAFAKKNMVFGRGAFHPRVIGVTATVLSGLLAAAGGAMAGEHTAPSLRTVLASPEMPPLPAPPEEGTAEAAAEIARVVAIQSDPDNGRRRLNARAELDQPPVQLLQSRGVVPPADRAPALHWFAGAVTWDLAVLAEQAGASHDRAAPHEISDEVRELAGRTAGSAYPAVRFSQLHALFGLLSELEPACIEDYELMLSDMALDMEFSGQHRRSDVRASHLVTGPYLALVGGNREIERDLIRAGAELSVFIASEGCPLDRIH